MFFCFLSVGSRIENGGKEDLVQHITVSFFSAFSNGSEVDVDYCPLYVLFFVFLIVVA